MPHLVVNESRLVDELQVIGVALAYKRCRLRSLGNAARKIECHTVTEALDREVVLVLGELDRRHDRGRRVERTARWARGRRAGLLVLG